jgi:hypothetical protein
MRAHSLFWGMACAVIGLLLATSLIAASDSRPSSVADATPGTLEPWLYLPFVSGGPKVTPTPAEPRTVALVVDATWRLFSTGNSYPEALAGANLLADGPGYPFAEVGQYHTHWDQYYVEKDFLAFDTAPIPASARVLTATLIISNCTAVQADRPFQVELYRASVGEAVTVADWNAYDGPQLAHFPSAACGGSPVVLSLDPSVVTPGTATRLALLTDRIRMGQEPPRDQGDTAQIATAASAVSLRVTYKEQ